MQSTVCTDDLFDDENDEMLVEEKVVVSPDAGSGVEDVIVDKPDVSVPTIIEGLADALSGQFKDEPPAYYSNNIPDDINPGVQIDSFGNISLPFDEHVADRMFHFARPNDIQTDPLVIPADKVSLRHRGWNAKLDKTVDEVHRALAIEAPREAITCGKPNMIVARSGQPLFVRQSRSDAFVHMIILLPSTFTGGVVGFILDGVTESVDLAQHDEFSTSIIAWYNDRPPYFAPIETGEVALLHYELRPSSLPIPSPFGGQDSTQKLRMILRLWKENLTVGPQKAIYLLAAQDLARDFSTEDLEGQDRHLIQKIRRTVEAAGFEIGFARIEHNIRGRLEHIPPGAVPQPPTTSSLPPQWKDTKGNTLICGLHKSDGTPVAFDDIESSTEESVRQPITSLMGPRKNYNSSCKSDGSYAELNYVGYAMVMWPNEFFHELQLGGDYAAFAIRTLQSSNADLRYTHAFFRRQDWFQDKRGRALKALTSASIRFKDADLWLRALAVYGNKSALSDIGTDAIEGLLDCLGPEVVLPRLEELISWEPSNEIRWDTLGRLAHYNVKEAWIIEQWSIVLMNLSSIDASQAGSLVRKLRAHSTPETVKNIIVPALCRTSSEHAAYEFANALADGYTLQDMTSSDAEAITQAIGNLLLHVIQHAALVLGSTSTRPETVTFWSRSIIHSCRVTGNHGLLSSLVIRLMAPVPSHMAVAQLEVLSTLVSFITTALVSSGQSASLRMFETGTLSLAGVVAAGHGLRDIHIDGIVLIVKAQRSVKDFETYVLPHVSARILNRSNPLKADILWIKRLIRELELAGDCKLLTSGATTLILDTVKQRICGDFRSCSQVAPRAHQSIPEDAVLLASWAEVCLEAERTSYCGDTLPDLVHAVPINILPSAITALGEALASRHSTPLLLMSNLSKNLKTKVLEWAAQELGPRPPSSPTFAAVAGPQFLKISTYCTVKGCRECPAIDAFLSGQGTSSEMTTSLLTPESEHHVEAQLRRLTLHFPRSLVWTMHEAVKGPRNAEGKRNRRIKIIKPGLNFHNHRWISLRDAGVTSLRSLGLNEQEMKSVFGDAYMSLISSLNVERLCEDARSNDERPSKRLRS